LVPQELPDPPGGCIGSVCSPCSAHSACSSLTWSRLPWKNGAGVESVIVLLLGLEWDQPSVVAVESHYLGLLTLVFDELATIV
jgi:hypothetical protein